MAGDLRADREAPDPCQRVEPVDSDCRRGARAATGGVFLRRSVVVGMDERLVAGLPRRAWPDRRSPQPGPCRDRVAGDAASARCGLWRLRVVAARRVVVAAGCPDPAPRTRATCEHRNAVGQHQPRLAARGREVLPASGVGIGLSELVVGQSAARLFRTLRRLRSRARAGPSGIGQRSGRTAVAGTGVPHVPARLAAGRGGPLTARRRPQLAHDPLHAARDRPLLPSDERLPARGRRSLG